MRTEKSTFLSLHCTALPNNPGGIKMRKAILFSAIPAALIIGITMTCLKVQASGPPMQEGRWEISTEVEMPGMPEDMAMQSFKHTECLTGDNFVPRNSKGSGSGGECEINDVRISGNTVSWTMQCDTGQGTMNGEGSITYNGDTFEGTMKTVMSGMEINQYLQGRRIGDCN